jgi:hypothetical protein
MTKAHVASDARVVSRDLDGDPSRAGRDPGQIDLDDPIPADSTT